MNLGRTTYDLHLHTCWSYDATMLPEDCFTAAQELRVTTIAVTEHHNFDSQKELTIAAKDYPDIRLIRGAELSVDCSIGSVDLICLGLPKVLPEELDKVMDEYHAWQQNMGKAICAGMQALGHDYTDKHRMSLQMDFKPERVRDRQGITHVQNELQRNYFLERGFITSADEYSLLLQKIQRTSGVPAYPAAEMVVPAVQRAGGLVVIAHPTGYFNRDDEGTMDRLREELSLDGIECGHCANPPELVSVYRAYCEKHGLLSTAGSDIHHASQIESRFGVHLGKEEWLNEILERLD